MVHYTCLPSTRRRFDSAHPLKGLMNQKEFTIHPKKFEVKSISYSDSTLISSVKPIEEGGITAEKAEDLETLVEAPLLESCKILHEKGIKTVFSSANKKDIANGYAYITLDLEALSEKNREIALRIGKLGTIHGATMRDGIYIEIPIRESSTVGEVKQEAVRIAKGFEQQ